MTATDLLPTRNKNKVPQGWFHPIGAQKISQALTGIDQYECIYLRFLGSSMNAKQQNQLYVLFASYTPPEFTMMKENWCVDISAVPKNIAAKVKELLLSEGLPRIRSWMEAKHTPVWFRGWKHLDIRFDLNSQCLVFTETGAA